MADLLRCLRFPNLPYASSTDGITKEGQAASGEGSMIVSGSDAEPTMGQRSSTVAPANVYNNVEDYLAHNEDLLHTRKRQQATSKTAKGQDVSSSKEAGLGLFSGKISGPETSGAIARLYMMAQKLRVKVEFDVHEASPQIPPLFQASLRLDGKEIEHDGTAYFNKKEAKAAVSLRGIELLERMDEKREAESKMDKNENWIGLLAEYCVAEGIAPPAYDFHQVEDQLKFVCSVRIEKRLEAFGSSSKLFPTKKAAKANAASEAVEWLRETSLLEKDCQHPKKKKRLGSSHNTAPIVSGGSMSVGEEKLINEQEDAVEVQKVTKGQKTLGEQEALRSVKEISFAKKVNAPEYRLASTEQAPTIYSGAAYFTNDPLVKGPIGAIRHVRGRKVAKEQCAKKVLEFLVAEAKMRDALPYLREEALRMGFSVNNLAD
ncbi:MAG: hypothetical protein M1819_002386 [Sarea resinae]|nr:MAG: hypothetical protein M1819_002386 [Sarea resinae]